MISKAFPFSRDSKLSWREALKILETIHMGKIESSIGYATLHWYNSLHPGGKLLEFVLPNGCFGTPGAAEV